MPGVATKRWTIVDETGRRHEVGLRHSLLGATLTLDGRSLRYKPFASPAGTYSFAVASHSATLEVHRDLSGYLYDLRLDGRVVGDHGLTLAPAEGPAALTSGIEQRLRLEQARKSGANWFYWIGGLSMINSLLYAAGIDWGFIAGLGMTQFIDGLAIGFSDTVRTPIYAIILDVGVAALFLWIGRSANAGRMRVYTAGMVIYALDALLFVLVGDWIVLAFHGLALYGMWAGWRAARSLRGLDRAIASPFGAQSTL